MLNVHSGKDVTREKDRVSKFPVMPQIRYGCVGVGGREVETCMPPLLCCVYDNVMISDNVSYVINRHNYSVMDFE